MKTVFDTFAGRLFRAAVAGLMAFVAPVAFAQNITVDTLVARLAKQVYEFPQEKIHVTTDRDHYMGGDTVWFRAFVADASTHIPVRASKYVYVELANPFDTLVARVKVKESAGVYCGYIPLDAQIAEGTYTMHAYTMFMENAGKEYFFKKGINVVSPYSVRFDIGCRFGWSGNMLDVEVDYTDKTSDKLCEFEKMYYIAPDGTKRECTRRSGNVARFRLKPSEIAKPYVLIGFGAHEKFVRLPDEPHTEFDVAFFPEGGYIVPGVKCRMAFKATDSNGVGIDVAGNVTDSRGNVAGTISVAHAGMGVVELTAVSGESYKAEVTAADGTAGTFALPAASGRAAVLHLHHGVDSIGISAVGNVAYGSFIILQQRGRMLASAPIGTSTIQWFEKEALPEGVVQVLLLDRNINTLSERLFFARGTTTQKAVITPEHDTYTNRQRVKVGLKLDNLMRGGKGSVTVAVTDNKSVPADRSMSIGEQLLLQSDIKGTVEQPQYYFNPANKNADSHLDLLMMTQGWRRYNIPQVLHGSIGQSDVPLEIGQEVNGVVKSRWRNKPVSDANVSLIAPKAGYTAATTTDSKGIFRFNGFDFPVNTGFMIQAFDGNGNKMINFEVFDQKFPTLQSMVFPQASSHLFDQYANMNTQRIESNIMLKQIMLEEVTIIGRKHIDAGSVYSSLSVKSFNKQKLDELRPSNLDDIVQLIPGILMRNGNLYYRGKIVSVSVNGVIEEFMLYSPRYEELKNKYNIDAIKGVDFIPSYNAVIYGTRATAGGVLNITIKDGTETNHNFGSEYVKVHLPLGYQKPVEFYSPKYANAGTAGSGTVDLRSTVCWLPCVETDENGCAQFDFYTSDSSNTDYTIYVEGLTESGETVCGKNVIKIKNNE